VEIILQLEKVQLIANASMTDNGFCARRLIPNPIKRKQ